MELEWKPAEQAPKGKVVMTMISDDRGIRNMAKLYFKDGLWWMPDGSGYVYYTPTHYMA